MNLNEPILIPGKRKSILKNKFLMGPPLQPIPKSKTTSSLKSLKTTSELPWGKSHASVGFNISLNKKSTSSRTSSTADENKIILAITEGRGEARCEVGMAAISVSTAHLILCQTSDNHSYINTLTKINIINPDQILYPSTFDKSLGNRLIEEVKKQFPQIKYISIPRLAFNKSNGLDKLYKICLPISFPILIMLKSRYYTLAAASGLLTYLQDNLYIYYANKSVKIDYQASEGYSIIDISTADRLELVRSTQLAHANKYSSLFGILNRCLTRVGRRNLRSIILQPLYLNEKINERLNCVEELMRHSDILLSVQSILPKLTNIDQLLSISTLIPEFPDRCSNRHLNYILLLNSVIETISPLRQTFKRSSQSFFVEMREFLDNEAFDEIKSVIEKTICETAYVSKGIIGDTQRIWAIKPGINGLLDLVRKIYSERIQDMREYVKKLSDKYDLPLILGNNNKKGYHFILQLNQTQKKNFRSKDLPKEFIQVFRLSNSFTMKTVELINISTRIDDILIDLFSISNTMIHKLILEIKPYSHLFYKLVENIAYLDVLQSFAELSRCNNWTRPKFNEYTEVIDGHHPLLDFLCQTPIVSNPISSCEHFNVHLITGPNGSGKSVFIRQVMLLQIMAQAGCFIPAQSAVFRPADRMFARVSNEDDMESGASSFILEMNEIKYILTTMTDQSLIIVDELGRSTSVEEGTAIAMAICNRFATTKAYIYLSTHYTLMTKLADLFANIKIWQMETISQGQPNDLAMMKLDFKFNLIPGVSNLKYYGLYLIKNIWPKGVLNHVNNLQKQLTKKTLNVKINSLHQGIRLKRELECKLNKLKLQQTLTIGNLNQYLTAYYEELKLLGIYPQNAAGNNEMFNMPGPSVPQNNAFNHSIFDVRNEISGARTFFTERSFQGEFEEIDENEDHQSNITLIMNEDNLDVDEKMETFPAMQFSQESANYFPVENEIRHVFTPNPQLNLSTTSSSYQPLHPEIILNCDEHKLTPDQFENDISTSDMNHACDNPEFLQPQKSSFQIQQEECAFTNNFSVHVQNLDIPRTSTPLIINPDEAKNTSHQTPLNLSQNKPKITITTFSNVDEIDMTSVEEDIRSFMTEIENLGSFNNEEKVEEEEQNSMMRYMSCNETLNSPKLNNQKEAMTNQIQINQQGVINPTVREFSKYVNPPKATNNHKHLHIFPTVRIIEGPNDKSFIANSGSGTFGVVVKPVVIGTEIDNTPGELVAAEKDKNETFVSTIEKSALLEIADVINIEEYFTDDQENILDPSIELNKDANTTTANSTFSSISYSPPLCDDNPIVINESVQNNAMPQNAEDKNSKKNKTYETSPDLLESSQHETMSSATLYALKQLIQINKEQQEENNTESNRDFTKTTQKTTSNDDENKHLNYTIIYPEGDPIGNSQTEQTSILSRTPSKRSNLSSVKSMISSETTQNTNPLKVFSSDTNTAIEKAQINKRKFIVPSKNNSMALHTDKSLENDQVEKPIEIIEPKITKGKNISKFIPPWKLTEKQIRQEFFEQDIKLFDTINSDSPDMIKMLEQRLRRPTPRQIKQQTTFAVLKKTTSGFKVSYSPEDKNPKRRRKNSPKKFFSSHRSINMNIFSDRNAKTFEQFIQSEEKDIKFFDFKFGHEKGMNSRKKTLAVNESNNILNFKQADEVDKENISMTFVRKSSLTSSQKHQNLTFSPQENGSSLTADGFYKRKPSGHGFTNS